MYSASDQESDLQLDEENEPKKRKICAVSVQSLLEIIVIGYLL